MTCAIVLYFDRAFEIVDPVLGLTSAAEIRSLSSDPSEDIVVLVTRGFHRVSADQTARLRELRYRIVDAEPLLRAIKAEYPFASETRIWRGDPFHEACFLRWLILEKHFDGEPVLAMDSDIVWRVDPYRLLESWKNGGSFLCFRSCCIAHIADRSWFEAYRNGLERLARDPTFGADFKKGHFTGLYHDQALCQYLIARGELPNDQANFLGHGFAERFFMSSNPIGISRPAGGPPLTFEQDERSERINGKIVPFWHMQSSFARLLSKALLIPLLMSGQQFRIPYERRTKDGPTDAFGALLDHIHFMVARGRLTLQFAGGPDAVQLTYRSHVYEKFFRGDLARQVFTEALWWKPGEWA